MTGENDDPAAALLSMREAQRKAAARVKAPPYYHPAIGFTFFLQFTALELEGSGTALIVLSLALLAVLVTQYQKQTGTWQNGFTAGGPRARRLIWGGVAVITACLAIGVWMKEHVGVDGVLIAMGAIVGLLATWLGYAWERAFIAEAGADR